MSRIEFPSSGYISDSDTRIPSLSTVNALEVKAKGNLRKTNRRLTFRNHSVGEMVDALDPSTTVAIEARSGWRRRKKVIWINGEMGNLNKQVRVPLPNHDPVIFDLRSGINSEYFPTRRRLRAA